LIVRRWPSVLLTLPFLAVIFSSFAVAATHLSETGSTLLFPLMSVWIAKYMPLHPEVELSAQATGSSAGVADALSGEAQIGGSDRSLTAAQTQAGLLNIPLAVSAQEIDYNVPELRGGPPLRLSGPTLAGIYDGSIDAWDNARIRSINPGRSLPHHPIVPIHRSEGSGDTFLFTTYLTLSTPSLNRGLHAGNRVDWPPLASALEARGNAGMIDLCARVPYSIAYVGISYANRARAAGLDAADLKNRAGAYLAVSAKTVQAAVDAAGRESADGRASMIFAAGADSYPLVNLEYAVVKERQTTPAIAANLRDFLQWAVSPADGNEPNLLGEFHFVPLPSQVRSIAQQQINRIRGPE
jgi:phosphate transport system substrate-binding protein